MPDNLINKHVQSSSSWFFLTATHCPSAKLQMNRSVFTLIITWCPYRSYGHYVKTSSDSRPEAVPFIHLEKGKSRDCGSTVTSLIYCLCLEQASIKINLSLFPTRHDTRVCKRMLVSIPRLPLVALIEVTLWLTSVFGITTLGLYLLHNNPPGYFRSVQKLYNTGRQTYVMGARKV